jgi:hypothetical protein
MADVAQFTTEQYIKDNSPVDGNVDDKYITSTIIMCQKVYIKRILGTALYNLLNTEINAGSVSTENQTLLDDYIQDCLLYYVLSEIISTMVYKMENKSVVKKSSENSQPIDSEEVAMLRDMYKDKAEFFANEITAFLITNASTTVYPTYLNPGSNYDTVYPNGNNYTSGWVLGGKENTYGLEVSRSKYRL